jgi:hypothetical protein
MYEATSGMTIRQRDQVCGRTRFFFQTPLQALDRLALFAVNRVICYLHHNLGEQDHRGIKQRAHSMGGFKSLVSAERFRRIYEEVRSFFRGRSRRNESVSLAWRRALHLGRMRVLVTTLAVA